MAEGGVKEKMWYSKTLEPSGIKMPCTGRPIWPLRLVLRGTGVLTEICSPVDATLFDRSSACSFFFSFRIQSSMVLGGKKTTSSSGEHSSVLQTCTIPIGYFGPGSPPTGRGNACILTGCYTGCCHPHKAWLFVDNRLAAFAPDARQQLLIAIFFARR